MLKVIAALIIVLSVLFAVFVGVKLLAIALGVSWLTALGISVVGNIISAFAMFTLMAP